MLPAILRKSSWRWEMWGCDDCSASRAGGGFRQTVNELEDHLSAGCRSGWYSYGHDWKNKTTCRVSRSADGTCTHERLTP